MSVRLLRFIVQRKIMVGLMVGLVLILGSYSVVNLDKELMPRVGLDGAYVEIDAGEMAAVEVERSITTPLEQKIKGLDGVIDVHSTTNIGSSSLQITFERGRGEDLSKEVESIVNTVKGENQQIKNAFTGQYGSSQGYEFYMDVAGGNMTDMSAFAKDVLKPRLEALPEVREVGLVGTLEHEVSIDFNREEMVEKGLDASQVIGAIHQVNEEATVGEFSNEKNSPSLRWNTKLESVREVEKIKIPTATGFIELKDIAKVSVNQVENSSFVWKNGTKDFIFVQVGRVSNVTQIEMAEAIRAEVQKLRDENLINGFTLNEMVAEADYVQESIDGVTSNIFIGGAIAILILLLFLRNIRATFIIGLSIPTSVLLTFAAMWLFDYSFNMLTLIGLGLGIGMMVDSSIVILESIYRKKELGLTKLDAVIEGTKEVASAVIASMLTTIVVFLPIGLMGGDMGGFMIMLSAVVALTLISSVVVAFTLIPTLSEKFLKLRNRKNRKKDGPFLRGYSNMVSWVIKKKLRSLGAISLFFLMFIGSLLLITKIPMTIMPDIFNRYTEIVVQIDTGITKEEKEEIAVNINKTLQGMKDVESNYVMDSGNVMFAIVNMTKGDEITTDQKEVNESILKSLRKLENDFPINNIQSAMSSSGGGSPVQVNIKGESFEQLQAIANDFKKELATIDGVVGATTSMDRTSEEQIVVLKEEEIEKAGLSQLQIRQLIEQSFLRMPVGEIKLDEENIPLTVKWDEAIETPSTLLSLKVQTMDGDKLLSTFIELKKVEAPNYITHQDGERFISVSADIEGRDLGAINRDVSNLIDKYRAPDGYTVTVAGNLEQQQELMTEMVFILAIALFLVYFVMAVQFNHLGHPLIVMSVIPMTVVGVILGLVITKMELSIMTGMGIVMLIGIVLNNAILLIDRTNQLRKEGNSVEDALIEAGKNRIRPIFMTTLTTAGGMLPLALASGTAGNYQAPMATAIISGLMFATFITLFLVPAIYRLFSSSKLSVEVETMERKRSRRKSTVVPETVSQ